MHRHGYQGRKFHRQRDQREALVQGLADSLIQHQTIETTLVKAKELVPYMERLVTKAKKADLHSRRQIISWLPTVGSAHKLVDEIAPKLKDRTSGYLRIERTRLRRGDNTQMARVSFVDDLSPPQPEKADKAPPKATAKQAVSS
ncbi:50S ribosomal protein L17 [Candidatus Saccharibacteria bacterium]|nr:50S ribosomal protein L17 [Candidatus Saccharibacteria bacterium]